MISDNILPTRLKAGSPGLGHASQVEIERRAKELALTDGRETYSDADLALAAAELAGGGTTAEAPEADADLEQVTVWDEPPTQTGHLVSPPPLEDESAIAEQLVDDGLEEADHDIRVVAAGQSKAKDQV
jgi:hypothetical protein